MIFLGLNYLFNGKSGIDLPMPFLAPVMHLGFVFKDNDLFSLALAQDLGDNLGPLHCRPAYVHLIALGDEQHPIQLDGAPFLG